MGRRKNENIRKVQKTHSTYYLSIPINIARAMSIREKQKMVFEYDEKNKKIIIKDWKK